MFKSNFRKKSNVLKIPQNSNEMDMIISNSQQIKVGFGFSIYEIDLKSITIQLETDNLSTTQRQHEIVFFKQYIDSMYSYSGISIELYSSQKPKHLNKI